MWSLSRMVLSFGGIFIEMVKEMLTLFMLAAQLLLVIIGVWLLYHTMDCYLSYIISIATYIAFKAYICLVDLI